MRVFRVVGLILLTSIPLAAWADSARSGKEKDRDHDRPRLGDVTTFGPVALGATHGLRLCHANHFGDQPISVEWVFVKIAPPNPNGPPPTGEPTEVVGRLQFDLPPGTGNCAEFAPDLTQHPEGVSIIAVLIGLLRDGHTTRRVVSSAQVTDRTPTGSSLIGLLLPAVQKVRVPLAAPIP